jgi:hypothetical protein
MLRDRLSAVARPITGEGRSSCAAATTTHPRHASLNSHTALERLTMEGEACFTAGSLVS